MTAAKPEATVIVKGNCGIPEFRGAKSTIPARRN
jgi:5-methyltetrahydrofolate--homocysteine methyltransferase